MDSDIRATLPPVRPEVDTADRASSGNGRIRCPLCGWEPEAGNRWDVRLPVLVEHVRYGRRLPRLHKAVDHDDVSVVRGVVAAFRLVPEGLSS